MCPIQVVPLSPSDPTLTTENLLEKCREVKNWRRLGELLEVPQSKLDEARRFYQVNSQRKEFLLSHWVHTHPAPSWKMVARSLQEMGQRRLAKKVAAKYVKGKMSIGYTFMPHYTCNHWSRGVA